VDLWKSYLVQKLHQKWAAGFVLRVGWAKQRREVPRGRRELWNQGLENTEDDSAGDCFDQADDHPFDLRLNPMIDVQPSLYSLH
jgi:hypothetical protein